MKTEELKQIILKEAIYIKNLIEEKKQIEEALKNLEEGKKIEDEGVGIGKSLANKKSVNKRLDDPHRLKEEEEAVEDESLDEVTGIGLGVSKRAENRRDELNESIILCRKAVREQLYESYGLNDLKKS